MTWRSVGLALLLASGGLLWAMAPGAGGGIRAATVAEAYVLPVDPSPGSISQVDVLGGVNGGFTASRQVTVWVIALVNEAGPIEISLSNDGVAWGPWQPLTGGVPWTIADGEGGKSVYARIRDWKGAVSAPASGVVILDQTAPQGSVTAQPTEGKLRLTAMDALTGVDRMRIGANADLSNVAWQPHRTEVSWNFGANPEAFVQFRDRAGNVSAVARSGQVLAGVSCTPRPRVTMTSRPVNGGLEVALSVSGDQNRLQRVRFEQLGNATIDVPGRGREHAPFTLDFPANHGPATQTFTLRRVTPGQASIVRLVVTDGCGEWQTLVGGGPQAF